MADDWRPISLAAQDVLSRIDECAASAASRVRSELPQYGQLPVPLVVDAIRGSIEVAASAIRDHREPTAAELAVLRSTGAERAREGVDLDGPLRAMSIVSRSLWGEQQEVARSNGAAADLLLEAQAHLWSLTDRMGQQFIAGHREAELEISRRDYQHRVDVVRALLLGRTSPSSHDDLVSLGLDPDQEFVVCRARPVPGETLAGLERSLLQSPGAAVLVPHERDVVGLMTEPPQVANGVVGLGPRAVVTELPAAFSLATRALATCLRLGLAGTHEFHSLGLLPAVVADREVGDAVEARYLTPLRTGRSYDHDVELSVDVYLAEGCGLEASAAVLHVHPNTLRQRLRHFADLTGADLTDPACLAEVWWAFRRARAAREPRAAGA